MSHERPQSHEHEHDDAHELEERSNDPEDRSVSARTPENYAHIHSHRALIGFDEHGIPTITHSADHQEDDDRSVRQRLQRRRFGISQNVPLKAGGS